MTPTDDRAVSIPANRSEAADLRTDATAADTLQARISAGLRAGLHLRWHDGAGPRDERDALGLGAPDVVVLGDALEEAACGWRARAAECEAAAVAIEREVADDEAWERARPVPQPCGMSLRPEYALPCVFPRHHGGPCDPGPGPSRDEPMPAVRARLLREADAERAARERRTA